MTEIALLSNTSIVFLGYLNPAIFQTQWLDRYKILPGQDIQWAEGKDAKQIKLPKSNIIVEQVPTIMVSANQTILHFPSLRIEVFPDKYVCTSGRSESFQLVKDVTAKTFNILEHTPVTKVGTNVEGHWKCEASAHNILKGLFVNNDNSFKSRFGEEYCVGGIITFLEKGRQVNLNISKSTLLDDGVYFNFNFQYEVEAQQAKNAVDVINNNYDNDIDEGISIAKELIGAPENTWKQKT